MQFTGKTVFITGANRGIGRALVEACLSKNVGKVYAASRKIENLPPFNDPRVVAIKLDISKNEEIKKAAEECADTQILINNAGILNPGNILEGNMEGFKKDMEINCFATLAMMRAFVPVLEKNKETRIVNIASIASYVNFPFIAGYSASKAALYSVSQAARIELSAKGIPVHIVNPGAIDTDMNKGSTMDMTAPKDVAESILKAVEDEIEDIIPDKIGRGMFEVWRKSPKELEDLSKKMYFGK
ncbi:SDR family oxidoreductase [Bdellovibrio sp. HCB-162]|uniref:SDR family oxidoreductase n=1 Tax=Bdellovibrio sp. HCB-162 TaxID=3394234 RepID=UPI0039BD8DA2